MVSIHTDRKLAMQFSFDLIFASVELPKHVLLQYVYSFFFVLLKANLDCRSRDMDTNNRRSSDEYLACVLVKKSCKYILLHLEGFTQVQLDHFIAELFPILQLPCTLPDFSIDFTGKIISKIFRCNHHFN